MGDKHIVRRPHLLLIQVDLCVGVQTFKYQYCPFFRRIHRKMLGIHPVLIFDPLYLLGIIPPIQIAGKLTDLHQIRMDTTGHCGRKLAAIAAAQALPRAI